MPYQAFISYSHAADGKLAPAVQSGLQRIAKPFYRLRAMRVFRDETSLHLTPKLWPLIKQALSETEHFVLVASPASWSFPKSDSPSPGSWKPMGNVIGRIHLGITRDARFLLEGDGHQLKVLDPTTRGAAFAPFIFNKERSIDGAGVAAILRQAHDLRSTEDGIVATLSNGQQASLHRDPGGSRFEIADVLIRGTSEREHVISPDGKLMCGILSYRSAGGGVGSMYDLVIREVATGRIISGHYRLPSAHIVGFTQGNKAVLLQEHNGELLEFFVQDGDVKAPSWYQEIARSVVARASRPWAALGRASWERASHRQDADATYVRRKRCRVHSQFANAFGVPYNYLNQTLTSGKLR